MAVRAHKLGAKREGAVLLVPEHNGRQWGVARLALLATGGLGTATTATTAAIAGTAATAAGTTATGVVFDASAAPIGDVDPTAPLKLGQTHLQ